MRKEKAKKKSYLEINNLIEEDILFFFLFLIGYPESKPSEINYKEILKLRFKNLNEYNISRILIKLAEDTNLKIDNENFNIQVNKETVTFIRKGISKYIENFMQGNLIPINRDCLLYEKQKKIFKKILKKRAKERGKSVLIKENEIPEDYRLIETMMSLEIEGFIKIITIYNSKDLNDKIYYRVVAEVENKLLKKQSKPKKEAKKKNRSAPTCHPKKGLGYLKIKSSSDGKLIGPVKSRHFMLLNFLTKQGLDKNITFERAYNAIREGRHQNRKNYNNEDEIENALENAKKRLQKNQLMKPLIIIIDKEKRRISLMFNSRR